ncbi:MAG: tyrosine-type recombinase/integrase [Deinococcales bacterium]
MQSFESVLEAYRDSLRSLIESGVALPRLRVHDLRHTAATLLLQANVPMEIVSKVLSHTKISITTDIYRRVSLEEKRYKMVAMVGLEPTTPRL